MPGDDTWTSAEKDLLWRMMGEGLTHRQCASSLPGRTMATIDTMRSKLRRERNLSPQDVQQGHQRRCDPRLPYDERYGPEAVRAASLAFAAAFRRPSS